MCLPFSAFIHSSLEAKEIEPCLSGTYFTLQNFYHIRMTHYVRDP